MTESSLQIFNHPDFGAVRTVTINGEAWFVAADICKALGHSNPTVALKKLNTFDKAKFNLGSRNNNANIVNVQGLNVLVVQSKSAIATDFQSWILGEILQKDNYDEENSTQEDIVTEESTEDKILEETEHSLEPITVTGKQDFMGHQIPVVLGGFGKDKKCICDKTIAQVHGMQAKHVREIVNKNQKRFTEGIDIIDLTQRVEQPDTLDLIQKLEYAKQSIKQAEHIYLFSERGYAKLIKIMDTNIAWEVHDQLMDDYFKMREEIKQTREQRLAYALIDAQQVIEEQKKRIEDLEETEKDWKTLMDAQGTFSINQLSQFINIGEYTLFSYLRKLKVLFKNENNDNVPYRQHLSSGKFAVVPAVAPNGLVHSQTRVYPEGIPYITRLLRKHGYLI